MNSKKTRNPQENLLDKFIKSMGYINPFEICNCDHIQKNHTESSGCFSITTSCMGAGHEWCICNNFCTVENCEDRMHFGCKIKKELEAKIKKDLEAKKK